MAAQLDPDNASILVAGGGGVALAVTRKLKDMGSWVWMLQRSETRRCELSIVLLNLPFHSPKRVSKWVWVSCIIAQCGGPPSTAGGFVHFDCCQGLQPARGAQHSSVAEASESMLRC